MSANPTEYMVPILVNTILENLSLKYQYLLAAPLMDDNNILR